MASSTPSPQHLHRRYQYQMLPSKDDTIFHATSSPNSLPVERDGEPQEFYGLDELSWKKQARLDLRPSTHRDR
jgi:hypothetical protein